MPQIGLFDDYSAGYLNQTFTWSSGDRWLRKENRLFVDDQDCRWLAYPDTLFPDHVYDGGIYIPLNKEDGSHIHISGWLKDDTFVFSHVFLGFLDREKDKKDGSRVNIFFNKATIHHGDADTEVLKNDESKPMVAFMDDLSRSFGQSFANFIKVTKLEQERYN